MDQAEPVVPYPNTFWVVAGQFLAGEHPDDLAEGVLQARLSALLDAGIQTFIDLTEEHETPTYYRVLRNLIAERRLEITYMRLPIPDRGVPSLWTLRRILDVIDRSIEDENPVFVHCFAGRGRTGTVVGCYLKRHALATQQDVIGKLGDLRKGMPTGRESSPQTPGQIGIVQHWKEGA